MHQATASVYPGTQTCRKGLFREMWEANSRNKMGMSLKNKSTKVHIFTQVFLEAALFTLRAATVADNTTVVQNQSSQVLLPFSGTNSQ